jgi:hypothetical protein
VEADLRRLYPSDTPGGVEYRLLTGDPAVESLASAREGDGGLVIMVGINFVYLRLRGYIKFAGE